VRQCVFDDVAVDRENYRVLKAGQPRVLGPRAFDLLVDLVEHPGRVLDKRELIERVWKGVAVTDNALTRAVKEIREAIGDDARRPRYIETVARRGYRFVAHVAVTESSDRTMLAVLPFVDMSREPQDYFCDGLTEELITRIARLDTARLGVIARTSAMAYKHTTSAADQIARELGVDFLLEGSVRREGRRVVVTAQLIAASDQTHLWADSYEAELRDVLVVQQRVAEAVAAAVRVELGSSHDQGARAIDPDAHAAYLRGRFHLNRRTADGFRAALAAFRQAVDLEPSFAPGHLGLARCYGTYAMGLLPRAEAQPRAMASLERAIELDDGLAEAHAMLGTLQALGWRHDDAEESFRRAIMLDPDDALSHHWYAMLFLVDLGRFEEAVDELRRAQALDPLALIASADLAVVFWLMREPARAIEQCRRVLELDPTFARAHLYGGLAYAQTGRYREAVEAFERAREKDDSPWTVGWLGYGFGKATRAAEARAVLDELEGLGSAGREVAFLQALVYTGLGAGDRALDCLERALDEQMLASSLTPYLPVFDDLRHDARFQRIVERMAARTAPAGHVPDHTKDNA
jgi:TolB-like protein/Tfp pilus assembly protein PilF